MGAGKRRWHEITFVIPRLWNEGLPHFLEEMGFSGCWLDEEKKPPHRLVLRTYLAEGLWQPAMGRRVEAILKELSFTFPAGSQEAEVRVQLIDEEDWASKWLSFFQPFRIGPVWIRPSRKTVRLATGEKEIVLDPGEAFGTGYHESTQLCLESIMLLRPSLDDEASVLDLGTGSGILAMFAARVGLKNILALDTDPVAVKTAAGNVSTNRLQHCIRVSHEPLESIRKRFKLIVGNLSASLHQSLTKELRLHLDKDGWLVAGGLLTGESDALLRSFRAKGLDLIHQKTRNDWECLILRVGRG